MHLTAAQSSSKQAPGAAPILREAALEDFPAVCALQMRNGLDCRSQADWAALWTGNPAAPAKKPTVIGWVLETPEQGIVGFIGTLPLAYAHRGRIIKAATSYSWVVDSEFRPYSLLLLDRFNRQENVELFVFSTVNAASERVYKALRYSRAPQGAWDKSAFWVTGYSSFTAAALREREFPMARLMSYPAAAALSLRDALLQRRGLSFHGCDFELAIQFDERFETFWNDLTAAYPQRLLAVRDRNTLQWHFQRALRKKGVEILTASVQGRLVAYTIFDRWDQPRLALKRVRIVDFQSLPGFEHLVSPAIDWMLKYCRSQGIHMLENVGCWIEGVAGISAPYQRIMKSWVFYYTTRDKEFAKELQESKSWTPTSYEGDASL